MHRGGWKGRPVIALGRKDGLPIAIHHLVSMVARPVKHVRLVTALLKAAALMQHKARHVPLHGARPKCVLTTCLTCNRRRNCVRHHCARISCISCRGNSLSQICFILSLSTVVHCLTLMLAIGLQVP